MVQSATWRGAYRAHSFYPFVALFKMNGQPYSDSQFPLQGIWFCSNDEITLYSLPMKRCEAVYQIDHAANSGGHIMAPECAQ
jgi:hypothetical protein